MPTEESPTASDVERFENERWRTFSQPLEFRHTAALSLIEGGPVLDVGCGDGLLLTQLKERGITAEGADISPEAVAQCEAKGLIARTYDPARGLPFEDNSFATVVMLDVLEHVYDPVALLREAARVSRGTVVIGVPNFSSLPARVQVLFGRVPENNLPHKGHLYWFNRSVLSRVAREAGLVEEQVAMNTFKPFSLLGSRMPHLFPNALALSFVARYRTAGR